MTVTRLPRLVSTNPASGSRAMARCTGLGDIRFAGLESLRLRTAHRPGRALRLMVDPSAVAVHLGAGLLQRPGGHGVRVGEPTLSATFAGAL